MLPPNLPDDDRDPPLGHAIELPSSRPLGPDRLYSTADPPRGLLDPRDVDRWFHAWAELDALRYRANRPPIGPKFPPTIVDHRQTGGNLMAKTFEYDVAGWSAPTDTDVVARRVTVTLDGADQAPVDVPLDQAVHTIKGVRVGQKVGVVYAFVDDAGNVSDPSPALAFDCVDDVVPAVPAAGDFGVVAHRQVDDGGPAPAPGP